MGAFLEKFVEPALPGLAVGGTLAGGLFQAGGIRQAGDAARAAGRYNAKLAEREAGQEEARLRTEGRREIGRQVTEVGASGVQMKGSPLSVLASNIAEIERRALDIRIAGQQRAALSRMGGSQARKESRRASTGALLSAGSRAAYMGSGFAPPLGWSLRRGG